MKPISTEGFEKLDSISTGEVPVLQWMRISDLIVDHTYQRPIVGKGSHNVVRIARSFNWSCFTPVVISPVEGGKFAIIDGQHRTTAAVLVGIDSVPCQIVIAARKEQAAAFKAINGVTTAISRMALQHAALISNETTAIQIADVCNHAGVELLRFPVPMDKQRPGQTMAVGAIAKCLKQHGEDTLLIALECVTRTSNNQVGVLSARTIKALCDVIHKRRDDGPTLIKAFDNIDLVGLMEESIVDAAVNKIGRTQAMADLINAELSHILPQKKSDGKAVTTAEEQHTAA